jgi:hypothetical protein
LVLGGCGEEDAVVEVDDEELPAVVVVVLIALGLVAEVEREADLSFPERGREEE